MLGEAPEALFACKFGAYSVQVEVQWYFRVCNSGFTKRTRCAVPMILMTSPMCTSREEQAQRIQLSANG